MTLILPRRRFLAGLVGLVAAPAVVKASSLMKIATPSLRVINPGPLELFEDSYGRSPMMDALQDMKIIQDYYWSNTDLISAFSERTFIFKIPIKEWREFNLDSAPT